MARTLSATTSAAVGELGTAPRYLVELGFSSVVRLATGGSATWMGDLYVGGGFPRQWTPQIRTTEDGVQTGRLLLVDRDEGYSAIAFTEGVADKLCSIWEFYGAADPADEDPVPIFQGVMDGFRQSGDDLVEIGLVNSADRHMFAPSLFVEQFMKPMPRGSKIVWGGETFVLEPR